MCDTQLIRQSHGGGLEIFQGLCSLLPFPCDDPFSEKIVSCIHGINHREEILFCQLVGNLIELFRNC